MITEKGCDFLSQLKQDYRTLGADFYTPWYATTVSNPSLAIFNTGLAKSMQLPFKAECADEIAQILSGNQVPRGAAPIALAYAGHQFGHFTMLGDGRALLLGELQLDGHPMVDIQLKGSGPTPYSRRGDGRATLSSMLREYLMSEALFALQIPTSRSLAVVTTGEIVNRGVPQAGAILTRVAQSHLRVGTFEYARYLKGEQALAKLLTYTINRHYPHLNKHPNPAIALLEEVMKQQIDLVVNWMRVGFIHGVMNTDNMTISGETIDYGPCAFMNVYHPQTVFSSIDQQGRYAFNNQPSITHWNLACLASALLPLMAETPEKAEEKAKETLNHFAPAYQQSWTNMMAMKLGFIWQNEEDTKLINNWLALLQEFKADYTQSHLMLESWMPEAEWMLHPLFLDWKKRWEQRTHHDLPLRLKLMQKHNPCTIPRNHLVEQALEKATQGDLSHFTNLLEAIKNPYERNKLKGIYDQAPIEEDPFYQTYCGT